MNSPREFRDNDYFTDSDATYCSEAEITNLEGRSKAYETSDLKNIDQLNSKEQSPKEFLTNEKTYANFNVKLNIHENIIPDSISERCSNVQPSALNDIINPMTNGANTLAYNAEDVNNGLIPIFQSTLSLTNHCNILLSSKNKSSQRTLVKPKDYRKKKYVKQNHLLSHSAPLELSHKRADNVGGVQFYSEPWKVNKISPMKVVRRQANPKKILLEHHRSKMKTRCQILTSRLYDIKNEVSTYIIGCGPKVEKSKATALFEEVKVMQKILSQLFQASKRLVSYIGGKAPMKSTEYLAADQTCEKLLLQLNPATFREDFTPIRDLYDSDLEGFHQNDQMAAGGTSSTENDEDENPEIMETQENLSIACTTMTRKNVHFQSPLINNASNSNAETFNDSCKLRSMNEMQNVTPHPSALKNTNCLSKELGYGRRPSAVVSSESSVLHKHGTTFTSVLNDEPKILINHSNKDIKAQEESQNTQKADNTRDTSLNEADIFVSDTDATGMADNSKVTSLDKVHPSIYNAYDTTMPNIGGILTTKEPENLPTDRRTEMIITDALPSPIYYNKNNDGGSHKILINHHSKIQTMDDPNKFEKDATSNLENTECHSLECRDSDGTYISQVPLNHKTIILVPEQSNKYVTSLMDSRVSQPINRRNTPKSREEIKFHISQVTNNPETINNDSVSQSIGWIGKSFQNKASKMGEFTLLDCVQESEVTSICQTQNINRTHQQGTSLTYLESSLNKMTHNSGNININPVKDRVTNEVNALQSTLQASQSSDFDMDDIHFHDFSTDEDTQMSCTQLLSQNTNISSSEHITISKQSHPQYPTSISKGGICLTEPSAIASDTSLEIKHDHLSKENRGPTAHIGVLSNRTQPPGWCNIFEQHKEKRTLPTLTELMIAEMISPGEMVLSLKGSSVKASLLKNAKILTSEGATFSSPMAWCSAWHEGKTVSRTLAYQRVYYKGVNLMDICQKAFKIAVEEVVLANKKKKRKHSAVTNEDSTDMQDLHSMTPIDNKIVKEPKGDAPRDIFMAIQSLLVHNDDEYAYESGQSDFWDNGVPDNEKFDFIDQW